jgi:predicted Zn finger-like uncharacterized protein
MRLICPSCAAQYEIEDGVIPDAGRDVQCSACGTAWFQFPAHIESERRAADSGAEEINQDEFDEDQVAGSVPGLANGSSHAKEPRAIDRTVMDVLREEAEFEARARQSDGGRIETQGDLGLAAPQPTRPRSAAAAAAAETVAANAEQASRVKSRRSALPDIEDISSTLQPISQSRRDELGTAQDDSGTDKRGFAGGFVFVFGLLAIAVAVYIVAPSIIEMIPAAEPILSSFTSAIDAARIWLAESVQSSISGMTDSLTPLDQ